MDATHYDFQLRQRLTSSGLNAQEAWTSRLSPETIRALTAGDSGNVSGVVDGLLVTVQVGTLNVQIGGGLALLYDATQSAPSSTHRWIEVAYSSPITATHDAGDAVSPRWDVVEIAPGNVDGAGEVIDFYNPNTGAFTPLVAAPLKVCTPTVTIRKGTPAAAPKLPAGIAGRIPLAYVYVAALAVALDGNRVLYCRPWLFPKRFISSPNRQVQVQGGGLYRAADDTDGSLSAPMIGNFRNGMPFHLPEGAGYEILTAGNYDGGGLPLASGNLYMYAAPPPYPAGYDAVLAAREIFIVDPTVMGATYILGMFGAIFLFSDEPPEIDHIGPPNAAGNSSITDNLWGTVSIARTTMIYAGCAYYNFGTLNFLTQTYHSAICSASRVSGNNINALLPIAADTAIDLSINQGIDPTYELPAHVRRVCVQGFHRLDVQGDMYILFKDENSTPSGMSYRWESYRSIVADDIARGVLAWFVLNATQELTINTADGNGLTASNVLRVMAWEDPVLAAR